VPTVTAEHVPLGPVLAAAAQDSQEPLQGTLQQKPSTQLPDWQRAQEAEFLHSVVGSHD
jgi:hypothetical protein